MIFKDPLQVEETPYEILGLQPDASPADIQAALPRFMRDRKNLPRLAIAQQALRKLKTPADRAQIDIWLYSVEIETISLESSHEEDLPDFPEAQQPIRFQEISLEGLPEFQR